MRSGPQKMRIVFIVDDNLIGNKKAIKSVLRDVAAWQVERGYPITFFTEASIDLADDAELMQLMLDANIIATFVGIESPNEASLRETKKFQNVRVGRDDAREGPPDPGRRDRGLVRDDHGVRQRRRDDLRRPDRVRPRGPDHATRCRGCSTPSPRRRSTPGSPPKAGSTIPTSPNSAPTSSP